MRPVRVPALLFAAFSLATSGCAAIQAVRTPGPTPERNIEAGMHRAEVEAILRTGASAYREPDGTLRARYEYVDGPHQATKIRAVVWLANERRERRLPRRALEGLRFQIHEIFD